MQRNVAENQISPVASLRADQDQNLVQLKQGCVVAPSSSRPIPRENGLETFDAIPASEGYFALISKSQDSFECVRVTKVSGQYLIRHDDGQRSSSLVSDQYLMGPLNHNVLGLRPKQRYQSTFVPVVPDEVKQLEDMIFSKEAERKSLYGQVKSMHARNQQLLGSVQAESDKEISALRRNLTKAEAKVSNLEAELSDALVDVSSSASSVESDADVSQIKDNLKKSEMSRAYFKDQSDAAKQELAALQRKLEKTEQSVALYKDQATYSGFPQDFIDLNREIRAIMVTSAFKSQEGPVRDEMLSICRRLASYV